MAAELKNCDEHHDGAVSMFQVDENSKHKNLTAKEKGRQKTNRGHLLIATIQEMNLVSQDAAFRFRFKVSVNVKQ